jgi:hypothetical protein
MESMEIRASDLELIPAHFGLALAIRGIAFLAGVGANLA